MFNQSFAIFEQFNVVFQILQAIINETLGENVLLKLFLGNVPLISVN